MNPLPSSLWIPPGCPSGGGGGAGGGTQVPVSTWGGQRGTDKCAITLAVEGATCPGGKQEMQFEVRFSLHDP